MNWNAWIRQIHRWLSIAFAVAIVINLLAVWQKKQVPWMGLLALVPLILLVASGLYMFALPYVARRRGGRALISQSLGKVASGI